MVLWSRVMNRRGGLTFTIELRRYFAVRVIQNWWLNILEKRKQNNMLRNRLQTVCSR